MPVFGAGPCLIIWLLFIHHHPQFVVKQSGTYYIYVILTLQWVTDQAATTPFAATLLGETTPNLYNVEANHPNWNQILAEAPADPPPSSRLSPPS